MCYALRVWRIYITLISGQAISRILSSCAKASEGKFLNSGNLSPVALAEGDDHLSGPRIAAKLVRATFFHFAEASRNKPLMGSSA